MKTVIQIAIGFFFLFSIGENAFIGWNAHQKNISFVKATVVECYLEKGYQCDYKTDEGVQTKKLERQEWKETSKLVGKEVSVILPARPYLVPTCMLFGFVSLIGFLVCVAFAIMPNIPNNEDYYI